ncbi:LexA regulated protein, partial [Pseudoalteromonas sp. S1649]
MAKSATDRTTPDLFEYEKPPGRPKTKHLPSVMPVKVNNRNQIIREYPPGF